MTYLSPDRMIRSRNYLVQVTEAVVAFDIAQTITDFDPASEVICVRSFAEAEQALSTIGTLEIAFVADCPGRFVGSALHRRLVERGGRVVLLGLEAETTGPTPMFDVLAQPFNTDAVLAKLHAGSAAFA